MEQTYSTKSRGIRMAVLGGLAGILVGIGSLLPAGRAYAADAEGLSRQASGSLKIGAINTPNQRLGRGLATASIGLDMMADDENAKKQRQAQAEQKQREEQILEELRKNNQNQAWNSSQNAAKECEIVGYTVWKDLNGDGYVGDKELDGKRENGAMVGSEENMRLRVWVKCRDGQKFKVRFYGPDSKLFYETEQVTKAKAAGDDVMSFGGTDETTPCNDFPKWLFKNAGPGSYKFEALLDDQSKGTYGINLRDNSKKEENVQVYPSFKEILSPNDEATIIIIDDTTQVTFLNNKAVGRYKLLKKFRLEQRIDEHDQLVRTAGDVKRYHNASYGYYEVKDTDKQ